MKNRNEAKIDNDFDDRDYPEIDQAVTNGIRKTINRFRERPFFYFTEADIHSSLVKDITTGNEKHIHFKTITRKYNSKDKNKEMNLFVSLVHQEYPTNFRYKKSQLLMGYHGKEEISDLMDGRYPNKHGDRGNFDLAVLSPYFLDNTLSLYKSKEYNRDQTIVGALRNLINKDNELAKYRSQNSPLFKKELLYAIEVKYLHLFNSRNKSLLDEVIKDNEKLRLAAYASRHNSGSFVKPINLVFCSSNENKERKVKGGEEESVITKVENYISEGKITNYDGITYEVPKEVLNIFVKSYVFEDEERIKKQTPKSIISNNLETDFMKWAKVMKENI